MVTDTSRAGLSVAVAGRARAPEAVSALNRMADRRVLIGNGCVISMDPDVGDFVNADVLIEGDMISRIGPNLLAEHSVGHAATDHRFRGEKAARATGIRT